ncbi:MAG: glucose-6-phosphate isomerase [Parachlamydiales bacterium]|nr:glucose-6-phosphate isomerase [Parachlamydiales bacterium]
MSFDSYKSYKKLNDFAKNPIDLTKNLDVKRIKEFEISAMNFKFLYAAERVTNEVIDELFSLAKEAKAIDKMKKMQDGETVNAIRGYESENRQVLHTAMRDFFEDKNESFNAKNASNLAYQEILKLDSFLKNAATKFDNIVQIGIGGSFLGPKALYEALKKYSKRNKKAYFIANVDPDDSFSILNEIDLKKTLFVTVSKSGTTLETLTNEEIVRNHLKKHGLNPKDHLASITGKNSPMDDPEKYLESFYIWDYVGGRYSVTSMVGAVLLAFTFGMDNLKKILHGASNMDKIALKNSYDNLPLFSALIGIWNRNFLNYSTQAIIPYSQPLLYFPLHLQQLDMESNGKSIDKDGKFINFKTGPIIFGDAGTNAQHSFYQSLHQGTDIVPIEFLGFKNSQYNQDIVVKGTTSQQKLLSNLFAQSLAFSIGKKDENPNKIFLGNRPNHILLTDILDPYTMGAVLSYYEHKVAFQGFIWNINSFDQEGVQLGKKLADKILDIFSEKNKNFELGQAFLNHLNKK